MSRPVRSRVGVLAAIAVVLVFARPGPAAAHTAANSPASNYVSRVTQVRPAAATFTARVIEAGSRIELRWREGADIVVLDYDAHPYLRIGRGGVEENTQSNAVYLNRNRSGSSTVPEDLHPDGPPTWKRVSSTPTARWHDHRIHWMGSSLPDQVSGRTGTAHLIQTWEVGLQQGATTYTVAGDLRWQPGPAPFPLLAAAVLLSFAIAAGAARRRIAGRVRTIMSMLLATLVAVDVFHLAGIAFGVRGTFAAGVGRMVSVGFVSVVAWLLAVLAIVLLLRGREDAFYLVTLCAAIIAFVGGLSDVAVLSRSSVPFAFGPALARTSVVLTLGIGIGLAVAGVLLTRPAHPTAPQG